MLREVSAAVAQAAIESGMAPVELDVDAYRKQLEASLRPA